MSLRAALRYLMQLEQEKQKQAAHQGYRPATKRDHGNPANNFPPL